MRTHHRGNPTLGLHFADLFENVFLRIESFQQVMDNAAVIVVGYDKANGRHSGFSCADLP